MNSFHHDYRVGQGLNTDSKVAVAVVAVLAVLCLLIFLTNDNDSKSTQVSAKSTQVSTPNRTGITFVVPSKSKAVSPVPTTAGTHWPVVAVFSPVYAKNSANAEPSLQAPKNEAIPQDVTQLSDTQQGLPTQDATPPTERSAGNKPRTQPVTIANFSASPNPTPQKEVASDTNPTPEKLTESLVAETSNSGWRPATKPFRWRDTEPEPHTPAVKSVESEQQETVSLETNPDLVNVPSQAGSSEVTQFSVEKYTVLKADSLPKIARRHLGAAHRWPEIYRMNKGVLGNHLTDLREGLELVLPPAGQWQASRADLPLETANVSGMEVITE